MTNGLANTITEAVYKEYSKLKPTNKPRVRSNGVKESTILAAIVAVNKYQMIENPKIISLSTGVKSIPDSELERSLGKMVHDCHAEILAIRGFNAVLIDEMIRLKDGQKSEYLVQVDSGCDVDESPKYLWNKKWQLALYISRLPCGDASMDSMESSAQEEKLINMSDNDPYQYISPTHTKTLRGRFNFKKKGYVRTKPGRHDSNITYSKSCSDKLCIRQVISLNNAITWGLMKEMVFLSYIIIPTLQRRDETSLKRCFEDRLTDCNFPVHHFKILSSSLPFTDDISEEREPSLLSVIKIFPGGDNTILEQSILNGVKNGSYTKGKKPLRKNCESVVSRYALWKKSQVLFPNIKVTNGNTISYYDFKKSYFPERNEMIESVRNLLTKEEGWVHTYRDNFVYE